MTFIKEPNSELAPGADFTGSVHFTTADAAGQEIAQKFTFNYKGGDRSGAAMKASLGFSFVGGKLTPHCYIDPSPPYSHQDGGDTGTVAFVLAQGVPDAPPVQPPAAPKKIDRRRCKLVPNQVDGPQNHMLCSVHGHVVDPGAGTEVAASIEEYHKIYWFGRPIADCLPDPGKLPGSWAPTSSNTPARTGTIAKAASWRRWRWWRRWGRLSWELPRWPPRCPSRP